jgi:hypothetical protein
MTKARNIANIASDGSALADGTINYTDVSGTPTLATVATSGAYADVTGTPTLAAVATSGSFNDLSNQPSPFDPNTLATVATTGAYADVTGTPTLATVATSGAYADVTGTPTLATVATTGAYADVSGTPTLSTVATTGAYADVTGTPTLATVATTGAYGDLSGTPAAALPLAGGTLTGNVNLGDNVKANFGAGSDLQIYHSGSHSYISEVGTGNLTLAAGNFYLNNAADTENMLSAVNDGAVTLFHNGSSKLATASDGISVTSAAGTGGSAAIKVTDSTGGGIAQLMRTGSTYSYAGVGANETWLYSSGATTLTLGPDGAGAIKFVTNGAARMTISSTGVISGDGSGLTGVSPPTTYGAVGTYASLNQNGSSIVEGSTYAGSDLTPAGIGASVGTYAPADGDVPCVMTRGATAVSGTWRAMGRVNFGSLRSRQTLFVRIS